MTNSWRSIGWFDLHIWLQTSKRFFCKKNPDQSIGSCQSYSMNVTFFWQVLSTLREFKKWKSFQKKFENWTTLLNQVSLKPIFACAKLMRIFIYLSLHWISGIWLYMTEKVLHICFWDILWSNGAKRFQITLLNFNELFWQKPQLAVFHFKTPKHSGLRGCIIWHWFFVPFRIWNTCIFFMISCWDDDCKPTILIYSTFDKSQIRKSNEHAKVETARRFRIFS